MHPSDTKKTLVHPLKPVHGEFINTHIFLSSNVDLPIVDPGQKISFPISISKLQGMIFDHQECLVVPCGTYKINLILNCKNDAEIAIKINDDVHLADYDNRNDVKSYLSLEFIVRAPDVTNRIAIINNGKSSITLGTIPDEKVKSAVITKVKVLRITS